MPRGAAKRVEDRHGGSVMVAHACEEEGDADGPQLPRFYAGRDVLITGATGFMGKVLIERLLWTCGEVGRLHLLMRNKRDQPPDKRLALLKQSQIFEKLRTHNPRQLDKLVVVCGDVSLPQLGLDAKAVASLREVSLVFHSAATVKFNEPLRAAVEHNVRSVERVLQLCDDLPNIEAFVHVSTAYSNAELSEVEERVYPPPRPLQQVLSLVNTMPEDLLAKITPEYISPKPNTYTFTKSLAENVVKEHGSQEYPVAIFRPTVVVSALRDPYPGWIESLNGPSGVVVGAGKGLMHVFPARQDAITDLLPVDIAIDTLLAIAWDITLRRPAQVQVYNCSTCENPTNWRQFKQSLQQNLLRHPLDNTFWRPFGYVVENKLTQSVLETVLHTLPLHTAEYLARLVGIKTKLSLIKVDQRLKALNEVLRFFSTREWVFRTDNVKELMSRLSPQDAAIYNLDPHTIDWIKHNEDFVIGTRRYLLQEKDQDIDRAKRHLRRMIILHNGTLLFAVTLVAKLALHNAHLRNFVNRALSLVLLLLNTLYNTVQRNR